MKNENNKVGVINLAIYSVCACIGLIVSRNINISPLTEGQITQVLVIMVQVTVGLLAALGVSIIVNATILICTRNERLKEITIRNLILGVTVVILASVVLLLMGKGLLK